MALHRVQPLVGAALAVLVLIALLSFHLRDIVLLVHPAYGCELGWIDACFAGAHRAAKPERGPPDPAEAHRLLARACELGSAMGCNDLAVTYEHGRGVMKDPARAAGMYEESCARGVPLACRNFAMSLLHGRGRSPDPSRAVALLEGACHSHTGVACRDLAYRRWLERAFDASALSAQKGCEAGDDDACTFLGVHHELGRGVARSAARARELWEGPCKKGSRDACFSIEIVERPDDVIRRCDGGDRKACLYGAILAARGRGMTPDASRSEQMLQRACKDGNCPLSPADLASLDPIEVFAQVTASGR